MPRPKKCRNIGFFPENTKFIPENACDCEVILTFEEIESLRLCDLKEMDQSAAADSMNVSRGTLQRILSSARKKVADAVINGKPMRISHFECGEDNCAYRLQNKKCKQKCKYKHAFDKEGDHEMKSENNNCGCVSSKGECDCHSGKWDMAEVEYLVSKEHEMEQIEENIRYLEKRLVQAKKRLNELKGN